MADHPILFTTPMVRAILDGSKTQTRRIVKPQPTWDGKWFSWNGHAPGSKYGACAGNGLHVPASMSWQSPYGKPGDRLWVRETWQQGIAYYGDTEVRCARYPATPGFPDDADQEVKEAAWESRMRPSIHMPRWASRITLEIIGVRVERLQEISEVDAAAEGCEEEFGHAADCMSDDCVLAAGYDDCAGHLTTAKENYQLLWDRINGAGSWSANPWVWVVEFRRVAGGAK